MLTGLILAEGEPEHLAVTLGALVPAVVEGLVGDAVVVARRPDAALATIAEIAGANLAIASLGADPWRQGASLARRDWLLCLNAGDIPADGWMRAVDRFLATAARERQPVGRFSRKGASASESLSRLAEAVAGTRTIRAGDLVQRDWLATRNGARVRPFAIAARIERDFVAR
jgi:hypothetical protein